jgi:hypothetical protein
MSRGRGRLMRQQAWIVVVAIVVAVLLVLIESAGIGTMPNDRLAGKAESRKTNALVVGGLLNVVLTAGVLGVILDAIITSSRARDARKRELLG